jgi:hypothetical protein
MLFAETHGYGLVWLQGRQRNSEMAKKGVTRRRWTEEELRVLTTLAHEQTKTMVIAQKLKRSYAATRKKASTLGVMLGGGRGKKGE